MMRVVRPLSWLALPLLVAGLVVADPWLAPKMPASQVRDLALRHLPFGATLFVLFLVIGAFSVQWLARRAGDFAALSLTLLFVAAQLNGISAGPIDTFDIALFGVLAVWISRCALEVTRPIRLSRLFLLASGLVVLAVAHLPMMSAVPWFVGVFGIVRVAIIALLVVDLCRDLRTLDMALHIFLVTAVISAIVGIVQFTLAYTQIYYFTLIDPPITAFKPTPFGFVMRASGFCSTAQHFSSFLVYAVPAALWRLTETRRLRDATVVIIILAGIAVSMNFGAVFATVLVVALLPFLRWPHLSIHLALVILGGLSLAYFSGLMDLIYDLTFGDAGTAKGVDQRKTLFTLGLEQFGRNPFVGTGVRGFSDVDGNFWGRPVHNLFGQAAAEMGLGGLLIMLSIFYVLSLELAWMSRLTGKHARISFLALVGAFWLGQSEPNLDQSNLWLVLALAQSTILILRGSAKELLPQSQ